MGRRSRDGTLPLFEYPLSRNSDPLSSFQAADRLSRSGKYLSQKEAVFEALRRNDGATSAELAAYMVVDRHMPARRLPDLVRDGRVTQGLPRSCKVLSGPGDDDKVLCATWWIVATAAEPS